MQLGLGLGMRRSTQPHRITQGGVECRVQPGEMDRVHTVRSTRPRGQSFIGRNAAHGASKAPCRSTALATSHTAGGQRKVCVSANSRQGGPSVSGAPGFLIPAASAPPSHRGLG